MTVAPRAAGWVIAAAIVSLAGVPTSADAFRQADQVSSSVVSRIADKDIAESSGLAYSAKYPDLAYTINDSKNRMVVYAIQVSTGQVVGRTDLDSMGLKDTESIYVDPRGRIWLGDLGDNDQDRDDVSIVSFDEPGPTSAAPQGLQRYPVRYDRGARNVEGMLVYPSTNQIFLINKTERGNATLFSLPSQLSTTERNVAKDLRRPMPEAVSDAVFTADGRSALVESASGVTVYDPTTWKAKGEFDVPDVDKGESMTVEPDGKSALFGSEGEDSPIVRVTLPAYAASTGAAATPDQGAPTGQTSGDGGAAMPLPPLQPGPNTTPARPDLLTTVTLVLFGALAMVLAGVAVGRSAQRHHRLAQRHRRMAERDHV